MHIDTTKLLCVIPGHKSTVWSVCFSTLFEHRARLDVQVIEKLKRNETRIHHVQLEGKFARLGEELDGAIVFPLANTSHVMYTRELTEVEKRTLRLKARPQGEQVWHCGCGC